MGLFTGKLNANEIYNTMFNAIISTQVVSKNIAGTSSKLVDSARVDGGKNGDTKLYIDTDINFPYEWKGDEESSNLLSVNRDKSAKVQAIVLDKFYQINRTIDDVLTARIGDLGYAGINSVLLNWLKDTKAVHDSKTYNAYIGTAVSQANVNTYEIDVTAALDGTTSPLEKNRMTALTIAEGLANLSVELEDATRDFNDYKYMRSLDNGDYKVVWNSAYVNRINKVALPTIFHKDGVMDKFNEYVLPSYFFGNVNTNGGTVEAGQDIRALDISVYEVQGKKYELFAGDKLPVGATYEENTTYTPDSSIICKVMHNDAVPFMSGFVVSTAFKNARGLNENHYLTYAHNTLQYRYGLPFITVKSK